MPQKGTEPIEKATEIQLDEQYPVEPTVEWTDDSKDAEEEPSAAIKTQVTAKPSGKSNSKEAITKERSNEAS